MTTYRITANRTDVVVDAKLRARQSLEKDAESSRRYIEATRLQPNSIGIGEAQTTRALALLYVAL
jgi:hypothetical protein